MTPSKFRAACVRELTQAQFPSKSHLVMFTRSNGIFGVYFCLLGTRNMEIWPISLGELK